MADFAEEHFLDMGDAELKTHTAGVRRKLLTVWAGQAWHRVCYGYDVTASNGQVLSRHPPTDFRKKFVKLGLAMSENGDPVMRPERPKNGEDYEVIDEPAADRTRPLGTGIRFKFLKGTEQPFTFNDDAPEYTNTTRPKGLFTHKRRIDLPP